MKIPSRQECLRLIRFGLVGASGVGVNMALFHLGTKLLFEAMPQVTRNALSGALAVAISILTNFLLNDAWTWRDRRRASRLGLWARMARYYVVAGVAGAVQVGVMLLLSVALGLHETLANLAGISAGIAIKFFVNNLWTFRADDAPAPGLPTSPEAHPEHAASTQHP